MELSIASLFVNKQVKCVLSAEVLALVPGTWLFGVPLGAGAAVDQGA